MSQTHDIDNDTPFFLDLDLYEPLNGSQRLEGCGQHPRHPRSSSRDSSSTPMSPHEDLPNNLGYSQPPPRDVMSDPPSSPSKGKGISQPLDIHRRDPVDLQFDVLSSLGSSSSPANYHLANAWAFPSSSYSPHVSHVASLQYEGVADNDDDTLAAAVASLSENIGEPSGFSGKGKGRERPPVLPPLVFMPTGFDYGSPEELSASMSPQTAGPSSYGSGFTSISEPESDHSHDVTTTPESSAPLEHIPTRRRTLSNISMRSTRSLSALSVSKVKGKLNGTKGPANIARKLLFKKGGDASPVTSPTPPTTPAAVIDTDWSGAVQLGRGSCFLPWAPPLKSCTSPPVGTLVDIDVDLSGTRSFPPTYRPGPPSSTAILRAKGRSYSSPFPLPTSPLDIVPVSPAEIYEPIPVDTPDYFDEYLPRELRIRVLAAYVGLYEAEHLRALSSGKWTALSAAKHRNRWTGVEKGIRELLKLSRVSKAWQSLIYDGQLWKRLPKLPASVLGRLCESAGGFVRHIDFAGLTDLSPDALIEMTDDLCERSVPAGLSSTRITTVNLQGCSSLTTRSLHHLLERVPALQTLSVKGLSAVTNRTCSLLSTHCPNLRSLDMGRCRNLDGEGIRTMAALALDRGETLRLRKLRLPSLSRVTDDMMRCLGRATPELEVLDLSYAAGLHNSSVEAFIALTDEEAGQYESVQLTAREAGRDPADPERYWRRVTRLRHIAFSSCIMLTDHACSHLAHAVPRLEFLELAGIGSDLQDEGLIRLFNTTPYIRRVDLEDASEISDAVLAALTPRPEETPVPPPRRGAPPAPPQTGHALEHLVLSHATDVTNEALLSLVRNCTRLRVLEADNTRMGAAVLREFVRLARERKRADAYLAAVDCRGIGERAVQDVAGETRPRLGWRAWEARELRYLDGRDGEIEELGLGLGGVGAQDECDEGRVVLKTFYNWQSVDAVRAAREKKRKAARRNASGSGSSGVGEFGVGGRTRWWVPSGRRSGPATPALPGSPNSAEGCTIM